MYENGKTTVVIVSYNTRNLLRECLGSFLATQTGEYEIWVVDNNSRDGSADMVEALFPSVRLVRSQENLGFGKANNLVVLQTKTTYVMLANPDIVFTEDVLGPLRCYLESHSRVGVVGPRIASPDGSLQLSCERFPSLAYELAWQVRSTLLGRMVGAEAIIRKVRMEDYDHLQARPVEFLWATCWLLRRELVVKQGLFDESFKMYDEDLDFCKRIARSQWEIHYCPEATLTHIGGQSSEPAEKQVLMRRGRRAFYRKHHGILYAGLCRLLMAALDSARCVKHAVLALVGRNRREHWERAVASAMLARL